MSESATNTSKKPSKYDEAAILVAKNNPKLNNEQIGKELVRLGISKNIKTVHDKWRKSDYLRKEITEVRRQHYEYGQRRILPKSLKKLDKLHNSDDEKVQLQAINTALKFFMGEPVNIGGGNTINIGQIQAIIGESLAADFVSNDGNN